MMISRLFFILLSFFIGLNIFSQNISIQSSYQYLYIPQWDKAIQTYNFSRPHLLDKQDLLRHGYNVNVLFDIGFDHFIPSFSYSYFKSISENSNLRVELNTQVLDIGKIHLTKGVFTGLGIDDLLCIRLSASLRLLNMTRKINNVILNVDSNNLNAYGIGPVFDLKLYYPQIELSSRETGINIWPFAGLGYTPFLWAPDVESILNQTYDLASKRYTSMLSFQLGFSITF